MALTALLTREVCARLKPGMRVASIGYPDIVAPHRDLAAYLGERMERLVYRADSEAIQKRHGAIERIPDAASFFGLLECELDVYDVVEDRGGEIIADFNYQFETRKYDAVLDVGSAEHCFNIGVAMANMAGMVRQGGHIFHENPFNWGNHGFWNLNPTAYADFYEHNGFTLRECWLCPRGGEPIKNVERLRRFNFTGVEANLIAVAERVDVRSISWPVQGKYKGLIPTPGIAGEQQREAA